MILEKQSKGSYQTPSGEYYTYYHFEFKIPNSDDRIVYRKVDSWIEDSSEQFKEFDGEEELKVYYVKNTKQNISHKHLCQLFYTFIKEQLEGELKGWSFTDILEDYLKVELYKTYIEYNTITEEYEDIYASIDKEGKVSYLKNKPEHKFFIEFGVEK